jgi:hypothetical protein
MFSEKLNSDNFIFFTMKAYENPSCLGFHEFKEDLSRIKYIKRLLLKYNKDNDLKERLILNHIITLQNVFGAYNTTRILFFKLPSHLHVSLKTFLLFLNYIPSYIPEVDLHQIQIDHKILEILKNVK